MPEVTDTEFTQLSAGDNLFQRSGKSRTVGTAIEHHREKLSPVPRAPKQGKLSLAYDGAVRDSGKEVNVLSYYFTRGANTRCYPRTVEVGNKQFSFMDGLRCLVGHGQQTIQIFNMTDGNSLYRLSFEPENRSWKLLSMRSL